MRAAPIGMRGAAATILLLLVAALAWRDVVDLDFGIHLAGGRWIVEAGRVPRTDPFSYTVSDHAYVAYHWLFQVATYLIERAGGARGLGLARVSLALATALLLVDVLRVRRVSALAGAAVGLAAIVAWEVRLHERPELASYLLAAATLSLLERYRRRGRAPLWLLPVIQLVWVNTHVHAFGWLIQLAYLIEDGARRRSLRSPLVFWCALGLVASCVNPYHVQAVLYPLHLATRMHSENVFSQHILELASPLVFARNPEYRAVLGPQLVAYGLLLVLGLAALAGAVRRRRLADAVLVATFGALSLLAARNVGLYAVVAAPSLATALDGLFARARRDSPSARRVERALLAGVLCLATLTTLRVVLGGYYRERGRPERFSAAICRRCLAVDAADWLADHDLAGHGFNNLNMGATLLWRDPAHKVFIDTRNEVVGDAFFQRYLEASDPAQWSRTRQRYGIEYAVLAYEYDHTLSDRLLNGPGWSLVYLDGAAAIFVRRAGPNGALQAVGLPAPIGAEERWRALREIRTDAGVGARMRRWLGLGPPAPDADFSLGTWLLAMGRLGEAEAPLLAAVRRSPDVPLTHNNLGVLYYRRQMWREAQLAFRNLRAIDPHHPSLAYLPDVERRAVAAATTPRSRPRRTGPGARPRPRRGARSRCGRSG